MSDEQPEQRAARRARERYLTGTPTTCAAPTIRVDADGRLTILWPHPPPAISDDVTFPMSTAWLTQLVRELNDARGREVR